VWVAARQVLLELELCSVTRARAYATPISGAHAESRPPTGGETPADFWRQRFESADDRELDGLVRQARAELDAIRRRPLAQLHAESADDLRELVLERGEGFPAADVAVALRCTPTFVRRARLAAGRDPEHGRLVQMHQMENGNGAALGLELVANGHSIRAAAAIAGVAKSTLADHVRRAR
jgi:hypothetical protein